MKVKGVSVRKISFRWQVSQAEGRRVRTLQDPALPTLSDVGVRQGGLGTGEVKNVCELIVTEPLVSENNTTQGIKRPISEIS